MRSDWTHLPFVIREFSLEVQPVSLAARGAGESIKPGVERSGTPGKEAHKM